MLQVGYIRKASRLIAVFCPLHGRLAKEELLAVEYIQESRAIDESIVKLRRKKEAAQAHLPPTGQSQGDSENAPLATLSRDGIVPPEHQVQQPARVSLCQHLPHAARHSAPASCHLVSRLLVVPFGQPPSATRLNKIPDHRGPASVRRLEPDPA